MRIKEMSELEALTKILPMLLAVKDADLTKAQLAMAFVVTVITAADEAGEELDVAEFVEMLAKAKEQFADNPNIERMLG